ncbi:hypothetical protein BTO28_08100 [Domibacillus epiphyticus]|uniref:Uncharacterized protein n=1 Tax=Domibacillus epiphyticus TaxID=1714355 RepID=A0A1V2A8F8_9BACI|nr:hypothetical protein BTO28_08100 [Domibacillus epiphyticus]
MECFPREEENVYDITKLVQSSWHFLRIFEGIRGKVKVIESLGQLGGQLAAYTRKNILIMQMFQKNHKLSLIS